MSKPPLSPVLSTMTRPTPWKFAMLCESIPMVTPRPTSVP